MQDNKMRILERLEAGEITAAEAMALMKNQENRQGAPPDPRQINPNRPQPSHSHANYQSQSQNQNQNQNQNQHQHQRHQESGWGGGLFGWVGEMVSDITESITDSLSDIDVDINLSDFVGGGHSRTEHFTSKPILQSLAQLELNGKNDKIEIHGHDGNTVQISCEYDARYPDAHVYYHEENGHISLQFDDKAMKSVKVLCRVPRVHVGKITALTKNDSILMVNVAAGDIELATKNDPIYIEAINCTNLIAHTKNDNIKARAISGHTVFLETTNSKIVAEDIHADTLTLSTTNSGIKTAAIDANHLCIRTTNSGLKLEDTFFCDGSLFWDGERTLEATTTNSGIKLQVPQGVGLQLEASARGGKVLCDMPLYGAVGDRSYVKGECTSYATAGRRLSVRLATSHGNIKIR